MKPKSKSHFLAALFSLSVFVFLFCVPVESQTEEVFVGGVTSTKEQYQWKSNTLEGRVKEALEQGERNYIGPIIDLMEDHQDNPDEVLLLLQPHLRDANETTQDTIIRAASLAKTKLSLDILSSLLADKDNGRYAALAIYKNFDCQQLNTQGGLPLKNALFRAIFKRRDAIESYLLFSCFTPDEKTLGFLKKRRKSLEVESKNVIPSKADETLPVNRSQEATVLDLALAEMGDADALSRVVGVLSRVDENEENLRFILSHLKFVNNKVVLRRVVELLKNKEIVLGVSDPEHSTHEHSTGNAVRLCDLAFFYLGQRTDTLPKKHQYMDDVSLPQFSDEELMQAYKDFYRILKLEY